jgi:hypothetical protein
MVRKPFTDVTNIPSKHVIDHLVNVESESESESEVLVSDSIMEDSEVNIPVSELDIPESSGKKRTFSEMDTVIAETATAAEIPVDWGSFNLTDFFLINFTANHFLGI